MLAVGLNIQNSYPNRVQTIELSILRDRILRCAIVFRYSKNLVALDEVRDLYPCQIPARGAGILQPRKVRSNTEGQLNDMQSIHCPVGLEPERCTSRLNQTGYILT